MASEGDDGGLFWSTFGGLPGGAAEPSPLEKLLLDEDCSVEALLDEEEVIQEFKACNERLVSRLSEPAAAKALLELVTREPPEQATSRRCFRYPFVAVELMTCGPDQFFRALVNPDHPEIMETLWNFLEATPPSEVNPVLAGYFSRTAASIFSKHPAEVVEYLRKRGTDFVLEKFLERLHLRSLAELLARLLCAERPAHAVFPAEGLVERLLRRLQDQGSNDVQEHVTLVIMELLAQKDSICFGDDILKQLTSPSSVNFLVDHIFSGGPGSVSAATSILSNLVLHTYVALKGISVCTSTPTLSPLSPPPVPSPVGEEDIVNVGAYDSVVGEAAPVRAVNSPPRSPSAPGKAECSATWLEAQSAQLLCEICAHLPRLCGLLDAALDRPTRLQMPQGAVSGVGGAALETVQLLSTLARTGRPAVEALLRQQLLPRCLELFFRHPWSSLLHHAVRCLVSEVLAADVAPSAVLGLLREGGLLERLVAEYREEGARLGAQGRPPRVGFMGHLHVISAELRDYAARQPECGAALQATEGWLDVVLPALDANQQVQSEKLGGEIPAEDRGLASSSASGLSTGNPGTAVISTLDSDFVLDDISDLDERSLCTAVPDAPRIPAHHDTDRNLGGPCTGGDFFDPDAMRAAPPPRPEAGPPAAVRPWAAAEEPWVAHFDDAPPAPPAPPATAPPPGAATGGVPAALSWPTSFETTPVYSGISPANSSTMASLDMLDGTVPQAPSSPWTDCALPRSSSGEGDKAPGEVLGIGSENLFALLGEDRDGVLGQDSLLGTPPPPPPPPPPPLGGFAGAPAPRPDPAAFLNAPAPDGQGSWARGPPDLSCLADFDPLFQPSAGAGPRPAGGAGGPSTDLAGLAPL